MCLGIACEVVAVEDRDSCLLRVGNAVQRCFTGLVEPVAPGDWLLMHAGFAVRRISEAEASANLALLRRAALLQDETPTAADAAADVAASAGALGGAAKAEEGP